jgi:hypothetical protein
MLHLQCGHDHSPRSRDYRICGENGEAFSARPLWVVASIKNDRFRQEIPKKNFRSNGFAIACGTLSLWYKVIGVTPKSAGAPVEHLPEYGRSSRCLRSKAQNKSVEARPYRSWGPLDCHCHWRAAPLQSPEDRQQTYPRQMTIKSSSVRKKSQMSAWPRSTSSTRKATQRLQTYNSLLMAAAEAVMAAEAAVMVVGDATRMSAAEAAATAAGATAATGATTAAVASALASAAAAVEAVVVAIGAG